MKPPGAVTRMDSKEKGRASVLAPGSNVDTHTYHPITLQRKTCQGFQGVRHALWNHRSVNEINDTETFLEALAQN